MQYFRTIEAAYVWLDLLPKKVELFQQNIADNMIPWISSENNHNANTMYCWSIMFSYWDSTEMRNPWDCFEGMNITAINQFLYLSNGYIVTSVFNVNVIF